MFWRKVHQVRNPLWTCFCLFHVFSRRRPQQCRISQADGGGACGGSSLQGHNKIQLLAAPLEEFLCFPRWCGPPPLSGSDLGYQHRWQRCFSTWRSVRVSCHSSCLGESKTFLVSYLDSYLPPRIKEPKLCSRRVCAELETWKYLLLNRDDLYASSSKCPAVIHRYQLTRSINAKSFLVSLALWKLPWSVYF